MSIQPPTRSDVHQVLQDLLKGETNRSDAAAWAERWVVQSRPGVEDPVVWRALKQLAGADLLARPGMFLHSEADFERWLQELEQAEALS